MAPEGVPAQQDPAQVAPVAAPTPAPVAPVATPAVAPVQPTEEPPIQEKKNAKKETKHKMENVARIKE